MLPPEDSEIISPLALRGHSINFFRDSERKAENTFFELMRRSEYLEISMDDEPTYEDETKLDKAQKAAETAELQLHNIQLRLEWEARDSRHV